MNGKDLVANLVGVLLLVSGNAGLTSSASALSVAEERFQWRGQVDGVDEILIRGSEVRIRHLEAKPIQRQDHRFTAPLPEWEVDLRLHTIEGRGELRLIEEPSSWNGYTAIVRIDDGDHIGDSYYEFELRWHERDDWGDWSDWGDPEDRAPWTGGGEDDPAGRDRDEDDWYREWHEGGAFRWEGRVDIGAEIRIRGGEHEVHDAGGQGTQEYRSRFTTELPEEEVIVSLRRLEGRGSVELIQTPNADNGFTAVVRVEDTNSGDDTYEFELTWQNRK